jgi:predicted regulator of Ras-like GTPase activity (Roadblock/LC7/MglB family)
MSTQGSLQDIAVADLIQQYCQSKKTAQLTVTSGNQQTEIFFKSGNVTHASLGALQGEEAVYRTLLWNTGNFSIEPDIEANARTVTRSWSGLLLEGARRLDESNAPVSATQSSMDQEVKNMELDNVLKEAGDQVQGFITAAIVGMDGIGLAQYTKAKKINVDTVNAQMTLFAKLVDTTVAKLGVGSLEDVLMTTEEAYVLVRFLKDHNYYLGIAAERKTAQLGNMRLISKLYVDRVAKVMPH